MQDNETKHLIAELELVMRSFIRDFKKELNEILGEGFTSSEFSFLRAMYDSNCQNVSSLASMLNVSNSHATSVMDRLVDKGLITRGRSEQDRRVVIFTLTETGTEIFKSLNDKRETYMEERFSKLSSSEIKELIRIFNRL